MKGNINKIFKFRHVVMFLIFAVFMLQFLGVKILVGSLTGSVLLYKINLIDLYAFFEVILASKKLTMILVLSVLPVVMIYLIFGRAFCAWVCPFDFLFKLIDKLKGRHTRLKWKGNGNYVKRQNLIGWIFIILMLLLSLVLGVPIFSRYISQNTNLFRFIAELVNFMKGLSVNFGVMIFSASLILLLLVFEFFFPRQWCRNFCPVGRAYGLLNKVSLIRLSFENMDLCKECFVCDLKCYMGVPLREFIESRKKGEAGLSGRFINCIYCGECILSCQRVQFGEGNIRVKFFSAKK